MTTTRVPARPRAYGFGSCRGLPAQWWETGDDGNRLALTICGHCPARQDNHCRAGLPDPHPAGVIRAGLAYNDNGVALPLCDCGYPVLAYRGGPVGSCPRCTVPDVAIPDPKTVRNRSLRLLALYGASDEQISTQLGLAVETVMKLRRAGGINRRKLRLPATCDPDVLSPATRTAT